MTAFSGMVEVETWTIIYAVTDMAPYSFLFDDEDTCPHLFYFHCVLWALVLYSGVGVGWGMLLLSLQNSS